MKLTILMPCLNESRTLAQCIEKANRWIIKSGMRAHVLVADNGSTDGSQDIARTLAADVISVEDRGYGAALMAGSRMASGEWVIMADADDSYDFSDLDPFIKKLAEGYDLVMGNRMQGGIEPGAMPWKNRYIGNPALSAIGRFLFKSPVGDFHCGMRAYTKQAFQKMDLRTTGMEFASEMVIKATLMSLKIAEVPVKLHKDGRLRPSHLRPWRDGWRHLRFMLLFSPRWLFIIPGTGLLLSSLMVYMILMQGPLVIGNVRLDIHTLFFSASGIMIGCLFMSFGTLIRMFAIREGLLPQHSFFNQLRTSPILEWGGVLGIAMILSGLFPGIVTLLTWGKTGFGMLPYGKLLREVSLSMVLMIIGGIILMSSLVVGFMALPTKNN